MVRYQTTSSVRDLTIDVPTIDPLEKGINWESRMEELGRTHSSSATWTWRANLGNVQQNAKQPVVLTGPTQGCKWPSSWSTTNSKLASNSARNARHPVTWKSCKTLPAPERDSSKTELREPTRTKKTTTNNPKNPPTIFYKTTFKERTGGQRQIQNQPHAKNPTIIMFYLFVGCCQSMRCL